MVNKKYPVPNNEFKRIDTLKSYNVLDTLPEKEYDAITRLASYICQVPIAMISLIDDERQWIKSKVGLDTNEVPRADAFCTYTILNDEILEVGNLLEHDVFKDNAFVKNEPYIRFYAGAPLIDPDGYHLGSLCVVDTVPRKLMPEQRDALRTLADEVMSHLLLKKQKQDLEIALETHKEFFNLFNASPEIHLIANKGSNIELINNALKAILGYEPEQAIGKSLWDFVGQDREQYNLLIEKAMATQEPFELETRTTTFNNEERWISWYGVHKAGKWYASGRDITYQKNILAELEQLSLVASKMINGVVISNADDKIIWTNDAFEKITGYNHTEAENECLRDLIFEEDGEYNSKEEYDKLSKEGEKSSVHIYVTRKDGKHIWLSVINSTIYNKQGEVDRYIKIIVDITVRKKAQNDLEILSFAAQKSPGGTLIRDANGVIIWMNEALENILGYTLDELKGEVLGTRLIGKNTDMAVVKNALKAVEEKQSYAVELELYKKDNTPVWVSVSNNQLLTKDGNVERQVGSMIDITARKKVEDELKTLSLVASNNTSGVVIDDADGKVEWVNSAFEKITGYNIEDVRQKHLGDILQGELTDISIVERARELSKNKQSFEVDLLIYRKDGQPLWISVINSVILNNEGQVEKYVEVIIDITAKKKVEIALIAAKEEAQQLSRAKDMFISVMSHEIRTPLNAVIGMTHLLMDEAPMDYQKENLKILNFSAQNLMGLINDVLDFAKIETGNVELEKTHVDLRALVLGIISSMQYQTDEKGISLSQNIDKDVPEIIIGDRTRLSQILLNLISNAVKFTEVGGITIDLKVIEQTNEKVRIRFAVADTGIGIANDKLSTIFESFKQAEIDTTRKYGGTGLGLAISKRLIELHDSRINVDSVQGVGSNFWFSITFNTANPTKNYSSNVDLTLNISVLVVDDNQINRLLINKILKKWGAQADFAENGIEAITKIESDQKYDVVLMDIHMPEMGGIEATKIIRSKNEPYFKNLPIIALTASMLNSQMNQIGDSGMNDYVLKPFEPKVLFEKLSRYQKQ
jgi:PAS domain S-box-containing protein